MFKLAPIVFGAALIVVWAVLVLRPPQPKNPKDLTSLQYNLITVIDHSSMRTALLTAGLVSIAFGLA